MTLELRGKDHIFFLFQASIISPGSRVTSRSMADFRSILSEDISKAVNKCGRVHSYKFARENSKDTLDSEAKHVDPVFMVSGSVSQTGNGTCDQPAIRDGGNGCEYRRDGERRKSRSDEELTKPLLQLSKQNGASGEGEGGKQNGGAGQGNLVENKIPWLQQTVIQSNGGIIAKKIQVTIETNETSFIHF